MKSCDELGLAASTFPESMLVVTGDSIGLKVAHGATMHDVPESCMLRMSERLVDRYQLDVYHLFEDGNDVGFPSELG